LLKCHDEEVYLQSASGYRLCARLQSFFGNDKKGRGEIAALRFAALAMKENVTRPSTGFRLRIAVP